MASHASHTVKGQFAWRQKNTKCWPFWNKVYLTISPTNSNGPTQGGCELNPQLSYKARREQTGNYQAHEFDWLKSILNAV